MKSPITLYFSVTRSETDLRSNAVTMIIDSTVDNKKSDQKNPYVLNAVRLMANEDGTPIYDSVVNFFQIITPEDDSLGLPRLQNLTMTIQTKNGNINGSAIFARPEGSPPPPKVEYAIGANGGEFAGAKTMTVYINQNNFPRDKVVITF